MRVTRFAMILSAAALAAACSSVPRNTSSAAVVAQRTCQDMTFPIYFREGSTELTQPALQLIAGSAAPTRACTVREVLVLGLADADGSAERNLELSRRRATVVAQALAAQGLPAPSFDLEAAGDQGAVTPTGRQEPVRRRAEVVIRLGPPG